MQENFMETIFASSNQFVSAIKVVRISGARAKDIPKIFKFKKTKAKTFQIRSIKHNGKVIDKAPVVWIPGPNSYTGEDMFELYIHGSTALEKLIYNLLLKEKRFKIAEKGEFTKRALLNGKLDLVQAEAINDLVNSETQKQLELANSHVEGGLTNCVFNWRQQLIKLSANLEALIDFSDEEIPKNLEVVFLKNVNNLILELKQKIEFSSFSTTLKNGFNVLIIGKPNVGKSSLMNAIIDQEVSIVTDIPGTTRDVIEKKIDLNGYPVYFSDTAGVRNTSSKIEKEGIKKTKKKMLESDIILNLSDDGSFHMPLINKKNLNVINVHSKEDLNNTIFKNENISISVKKRKGIDELLKMIFKMLKKTEPKESVLLTNKRQINITKEVLQALKRVTRLSIKNETELVAEELRLAISYVSSITSVVDVEDILDNIFSNFCIGK